MKRIGILLFTALAVASCGLMRRTPSSQEPDAPVILPLTDSADIARSRERAQVVMDSIARVQSGAQPSSGSRIASKAESGKKTPAVRKKLVDDLLDYAKTFIGTPYRLGASGPNLFDCSGFTSYVYREFGYELPHNSQAQLKTSRPVESFSDLRKGDLVFFGARGSIRNVPLHPRLHLQRRGNPAFHPALLHDALHGRRPHPPRLTRFHYRARNQKFT